MNYDVKDIKLANKGKQRIDWAEIDMPVLRELKKRFQKEKPLKGIQISACLHVTTETANLIKTLKAGGARVTLVASNPLSTQDDVAASLVKHEGIDVYAIKGEDNKTYYKHLKTALDYKPQITEDDGADLVSMLHKERTDLIKNMLGSVEETTTGVIRLKAMEADGALRIPVIAANNSMTKHLFDNRYGTGQSTIDGIVRATNRLLAGSTFTVAGYGWCGRGLAQRARGMGAKVIVTEIDEIKALEAVMDGFVVMPMKEAAKQSDFICTVTGDINVLDKEHFQVMKNGCIVSNSGHFNVEINIGELEKLSKKRSTVREFVEEFQTKDGRKIYLLGEGRLINLASAEGHPAQVMDMSFSNQALAAEFIVKNKGKLGNKVYTLPEKLDREIARLKLKSIGVKFDKLTPEQSHYLASWEEGT